MRYRVRLCCEQEATVEVEAPADATREQLRQAALEAIDRGEAGFVTTSGDMDVVGSCGDPEEKP